MSINKIFEIKNFGPIESATVKLYPLTIFIGPNNSGKTYLATLIYLWQKSLTDVSEHLKSKVNDIGYKYFKDLMEKKSMDVNKLKKLEVEFHKEDVEKHLELLLQKSTKTFLSGISKTFGVYSSNELTTLGQKETYFKVVEESKYSKVVKTIRWSNTDGIEDKSKVEVYHVPKLDLEISLSKIGDKPALILGEKEKFYDIDYSIKIKGKGKKHLEGSGKYLVINKDPSYAYKSLLTYLFGFTFEFMIKKFYLRYFYENNIFPAYRSGIMKFFPLIEVSLMKEVQQFGGGKYRRGQYISSTLSPIVSELVLKIINQGLHTSTDDKAKPIKFLQDNIVKGTISYSEDKSWGSHIILYRPSKHDIDISLNRSSSMINELAPMWFVLKSSFEESLFIIDEPEAHLHPDAIKKIAKFLVLLVRSGNYVIINTHSDFLVTAINNLYLLGKLSPDVRKRAFSEFDEDVVIRRGDHSIYNFKLKEKDMVSKVSKIKTTIKGEDIFIKEISNLLNERVKILQYLEDKCTKEQSNN